MKPFVMLLSIFLCSCSGMSARRTWLGNWKETAEIKQHIDDNYGSIGYFTIKQYQVYWADKLDNCEMFLYFTNTTNKTVSFNFCINFQLRSNYDRKHYAEGMWTYTNAIVNAKPNETVAFDMISNRAVSIKDGSVYVRTMSPITVVRN